MARKVYISFLGTSNYVEFVYKIDGVRTNPTRFIQEAIAEHDCTSWNTHDAIWIFATQGDEGAYNKNWKDRGHKDNEPLYNTGLKKRLEGLSLRCHVKCVQIPEMEREDDIWLLFKKVNSVLKYYDEIYFDITYAFRFIPMFAMSLFHYSQFINHTKIVKVRYAMLEGIEDLQDKRGAKEEVQVLDLTPLIQLQDWTYATATYLENGNANSLIKLAKDEGKNDFAVALKDVMLDFQTCRSIPIVKGTHIKELVDNLPNFGNDVRKKPFNNLVGQIKKEVSGFKHDASSTIDDENVNNGYKAAIWCFNNQLYQQAITILKENLITERIVTEEPHRDWRNGYGPNRTDTINEVKNYLKDRYIKQQLDKEHQKPLLDFVRETCKRKGVQHTIPCLVKDINKLTFDNHELNFCYYSSFDDSEIDFINETIIQQINKQKTTNNKYEHDIDMWDGNRSNEFHLLNNSGKDVITNEDRENVSRKLIIEKSYEKSDRKQVSSITINGISEPRNDFNHAGFAFGSSTEFPDGWGNTKIIEEVKKAFVELINLKFAGKYEMTEKNGFPYIKEK